MNTASKSPQELISECQGLVRSLASQIHRRLPPHLELDDLIADGQMGLAQAARDYDPEYGARFSTYAYYRIRGAIYEGIGRVSWSKRSHVRRARYEHIANDVQQTEADAQSAREPDTTLHKEAAWLFGKVSKLAVVYLGTHQCGNEEHRIEAVDAKTPSPDADLVEREMADKLRDAISTLPDPTAKLIQLVYFEGLSIQDAGARLGVSKSWASRLHSKALDQMARSLRRLGVTS